MAALHLKFVFVAGIFASIEVAMAYRAAVYEHAVILPDNKLTPVSRAEALTAMMRNLQVYERKARAAAQQGADILVFPEDGIYGMEFLRAAIRPYLEFIPDPKTITWTPCSDPAKYPDTEVQVFLSCLAMNTSMYIVANIGDLQPCDRHTDKYCPCDGHYQYNSNVVYDKKGQLIARYHKQNLFFEFQFDTPKTPEYIYFDTPFGRFATFTCFDILFHEPAIKLIEHYNITNVVFPTAWVDALPLLSAIQFHSAFAAGLGLNFLSANIHRPSQGFQGSGIYTQSGALDYYFDDVSKDGRLLIHDIHGPDQSTLQEQTIAAASYAAKQWTHSHADTLKTHSSTFQSDVFTSFLFHDRFNFVPVTAESGPLMVCHNNLCCRLDYSKSGTTDLYAFGAFDGLHTYQGKYYLQICALVKCATTSRDTCGTATSVSSTVFDSFVISGNITGTYIFPEILLSDQGQLRLARTDQWNYVNKTLTGFRLDQPLLSASLFGRVYSRDIIVNGGTTK